MMWKNDSRPCSMVTLNLCFYKLEAGLLTSVSSFAVNLTQHLQRGTLRRKADFDSGCCRLQCCAGWERARGMSVCGREQMCDSGHKRMGGGDQTPLAPYWPFGNRRSPMRAWTQSRQGPSLLQRPHLAAPGRWKNQPRWQRWPQWSPSTVRVLQRRCWEFKKLILKFILSPPVTKLEYLVEIVTLFPWEEILHLWNKQIRCEIITSLLCIYIFILWLFCWVMESESQISWYFIFNCLMC